MFIQEKILTVPVQIMEAKTLGYTLKIGLIGLVETHVYFFFRNENTHSRTR